jgi:hypothetical protein
MDLLDMDNDFSASTAVASGNSQTLSAEMAKKVQSWSDAAALVRGFTNPRMWLENELLSVTVAHEYRSHQGRMMVIITNKAHYDLSDLSANVQGVEGLAFKVNGPTITVVPSKGESKVQIASDCGRPFTGSAFLDLSFRLGANKYSYKLPLPTNVSSFSSPVSCDQATFMTRWTSITAEGTQQQQVFSSARPVTPELLKYVREVVMPGLNIGHIEGIDNEKTFTGCCTFTTSIVTADGKNVSVGVLLRLEGDTAQNKFRITVRAANATVSTAVKDLIVQLLS